VSRSLSPPHHRRGHGVSRSSSARPANSTIPATQACKALKEEGYRVILVNSNPATIMTDPGLADATYIEPITPEVVAKIIEKPERPDALLPTMGGQTALNTALSLQRMGVLERYGVEMIGASPRQSTSRSRPVPRGDGPHRARDPALVPRQCHRDQGSDRCTSPNAPA
jgi:hypothetical protein